MKQYFEILELQPGATPDEVKTAYRDLAKVWHPDRFKSDSPRLKSKAAEKLAEINEAYEKIRAYQARQKARKQAGQTQHNSPNSRNHTGYRPYTPGSGSSGVGGQTYSGYNRPTPNGRSQHRPNGNGTSRSQSNTYRRSRHQSSARHQSGSRHQSSARSRASSASGSHAKSNMHTAGQSPFRQSANTATPTHTLARRRQSAMQYSPNYTYAYKKRRRRDKNSMAIYLAAGALLAITVAGIFFFLQEKEPETPTLAQYSATLEASRSATRETAVQGAATTQASVSTDYNEDEPVVTQEAGLMPIETNRPVNPRKLSGHQAPAGFFTLGTSKSEVIRIQGRPEQVMEGLFRYGFSSVFFEDDVVIGWHQSHDTQLMVKMLPRKAYEATYFTKGSTRDEVVSIQGTPDHYRDRGRELRYGESRITFEKGRVVSWHQHADTPLKVKLLPRVFSNATHFSYNSTRDEVLSVQGTPTHFGENTFHYGYSTVQFKDDRVIGWNQATSFPLKIDLQPTVPTSTKFFTKGSTRNEVIAAQGTPDQYSEQIFKYGHSSISFENDRVVSWWESAASPLKVRAD